MKREHLDTYRQQGKLVTAAMYLRKSRAEEHMDIEATLAKHLAALQSHADKYGFLVQDIYKEVVSGESLFARPQMLRLMEAVAAGQYEAVLCMDMQRLGRGGMYDQGFILDTFKSSETLIVTPDRVYDLTYSMDEEAAEMQTFLSRSEYRMITKRLRRGTIQTLEQGAYMSNAPFGYRKTKVGKLPSLEIVPEEAEGVRQIFQLYADGLGCTRIERALNAMGYHGRRGHRFSRTTVLQILTNPVYIGKVRWNRTSHIKSGIGADRQSKVVYNDQTQWQIIDGHHPAIISQELWDQVQARWQSRSIHVDSRCAASPLAGIVHCGKCGRRMNMQGKNKGVPYLLCPTPGCQAGAKFVFVEEAVVRQLQEIARDLRLELQEKQPPDVSNLDKALDKMRAQMQKLESRRTRLYGLLEDGVYTRELFAERMDALTSEETSLKEAIAAIDQERAETLDQSRERQLQQLETVLDHYHDADIIGKRELLQSIIEDILYYKAKKSKPADFSISVKLRKSI